MLGSSFTPHDDCQVVDCTTHTGPKKLELRCVNVTVIFYISLNTFWRMVGRHCKWLCIEWSSGQFFFFFIHLPHFQYKVFAFPVIRSVLFVRTPIQSLLDAHFCKHIYQWHEFNNNNNLDWGPVPHFAPWKHCSQCGLLYIPVAFLNIPARAARCLLRPQPAVARNGGQMVPGICTQGSFTCRKSATWDR